jgi:hypothetical protein
MLPSLWPFSNSATYHSSAASSLYPHSPKQPFANFANFDRATNQEINANSSEPQTVDDSDSNSSDDGEDFTGDGTGPGHKRRLSVTTEAKRRTSIEDDDDEEVVHVKMDISDVEKTQSPVDLKTGKPSGTSTDDDGELIEIQHSEMQGVERGNASAPGGTVNK